MDISVKNHNSINRSIKICFVTETFPPEINGVAMTLQRLISGLILKQHLVTLIRPKQKIDKNLDSDIPVTLVQGVPLPGYHGIQFGLASKKEIKQHFTTHSPDIIYIATEGPLGNSSLKIAKKLKIPVISGFHTNFHTYMKHYRIGLLKQITLSYLKNFHNQTAMTLVPGREVKSLLDESGFENINILERGVDCTLFSPEKRSKVLRKSWGVADEAPVVLYVGRLAAEKNISLFIECVKLMRRANPLTKGVIVGDGPLLHRLQKHNPEIEFCGAKTGESLAIHYASADIFLFPSETETFGNVTLEAMASGINVLAFNYAAANRHITDGQTGFLAKNNSSSDFREKSIKIVKMTCQERKLISSRSRAYACKIDWNHIVNDLENFINRSVVGNS